MDITLDCRYLDGFVDKKDIKRIAPKIQKAHDQLESRKGPGHEFTGWLNQPSRLKDEELESIVRLGKDIRAMSDCLISIGIGGSYAGIHTALEFLINDQQLPVYYAGHNLSSGYLYRLLKKLEDKRVSLVVISKSGTTTEPALAFRIIHQWMASKYGKEELKKRIICITDSQKGALRQIALNNKYRTFEISDDIGGRFSVLTPVGLVPLAIAGIDIKALVQGARAAQKACSNVDLQKNIAYQYAANRYVLYTKKKQIEVFATFYQRLSELAQWWKQLHGESEGKEGKGLFPASVNFTADLHSIGQLLQEGQRNMFETFMMVEDPGQKMAIPRNLDNLDNFDCVAGQDLDFVNKQAYKATAAAHYEGGVPSMTINIPRFNAQCLGQLFYFFMKGVGIHGYLLGVNPFDQPGVEAYKKKMFALLRRK